MPRCFVIQPFDDGKFDKRYDDSFEPAIKAAELEPYRVDRDPSTSIPIEDIEEGIRRAAICLADITTDNPNVWFELGFAIAERKPIVLVCSDERTTKYPFDVQHRSIISYQTESMQDYQQLSQQITDRLTAMLEKASKLAAVAHRSPTQPIEGLDQQEIVALVSVAENADSPQGTVLLHQIRGDMEREGFTPVAVTLSLAVLLEKKFVYSEDIEDEWGHAYTAYGLTQMGLDWLLQNKELLTLQVQPTSHGYGATEDEDEDIPF